MKKRTSLPIPTRVLSGLGFVFLMLLSMGLQAQDEEPRPRRKKRPVRETFGSMWLIDQQTVEVPMQGTFTMDIIHRFGPLKNGYDDFFGIFAPSNIRLGAYYVPVKNLQIGFGFQKVQMYWDFNARYALLRQSRKGGIPVSLTYYGNFSLDGRKRSAFETIEDFSNVDRLSYYHELLIARKLTKGLSVQVGINLSHFNFQVQEPTQENPEELQKLNNDHFGLSISGRYKFSTKFGIQVSGNLPLTQHDVEDHLQPRGNFSFGVELSTSSHAFQVFFTNYYNISPQLNNVFNQNRWTHFSEYLLGFNMTRLWNF